MSESKSPIGLIPEFIFEEQSQTKRMDQIREAIERYSEAGLPIPKAWCAELERRTQQYRAMMRSHATTSG